jgi:16S rRNA (adenine1518-N6/adenine1519-N6)-dimethyltransferase
MILSRSFKNATRLSDMAPLSPSQTRDLLQSLDHKARKNLGQNFLIDGNIVRKSILAADIKENDCIVEIGPGLGTLSQSLLAEKVHLYAIELDSTLAEYLRSNLQPKFPDTFNLLEGDAVEFPRAGLPISSETRFKVVANLPYAITSVWLDALLNRPLPEAMVLMLQKEAADRLTASHGSKHFSAITIFLSAAFRKVSSYNVSSQCFYPIPKIDSALLHLEKLPSPFLFEQKTRNLIRELFTQRRKQINRLAKILPKAMPWLESLTDFDCSTQSRPDEIPLEAWKKLDEIVRSEI